MSPVVLRSVNIGLAVFVGVLLLVFAGRTQASQHPAHDLPFRVNIGGGIYVDQASAVWQPDQEYDPASGYGFVHSPIADSVPAGGAGVVVTGTRDDALYGQAREGLDSYLVDVPNGSYHVTLYMAEVTGRIVGPDQRVQDIYIEDQLVLDDYDIYFSVGAQAAVDKRFADVEVTDGQIEVRFRRRVGATIISALKIESGTPPVPTPTPTPVPDTPRDPVIFVNVGGDAHVDSLGIRWLPDAEFSAAGYGYIDDGETSIVDRRSHGQLFLDIADTPEDALFATARNGLDRYDIVVQPGVYSVDLLFTETELLNGIGDRVFDVTLQGVTVLDDFDIVKKANGYDRAYTARIDEVVADAGRITLRMLTSTGTIDTDKFEIIHRPELSGIGVWRLPETEGDPTPRETNTFDTTPTPTPPFSKSEPTPTPVMDDGGSTDDVSHTDAGAATVHLSETYVEEDGGRRFSISVSIDADQQVSGFSVVAQLPIAEYSLGSIDVSNLLVTAGFDGRARVDQSTGQLTISGGLNGPTGMNGGSIVKIELIPRGSAASSVSAASFAHALIRNGADESMDVALGLPLYLVSAPAVISDVNGDGVGDTTDVDLLAGAYGTVAESSGFDSRADLDGDGVVGLRDLAVLGAGL